MKSLSTPGQRQLKLVLSFDNGDCVLSALSRLLEAFPFTGRPSSNGADMAARLLQIALANIEIIAPRIAAMISYCEAEGLDQGAYLESLIEVKFRKKLHRVKRA